MYYDFGIRRIPAPYVYVLNTKNGNLRINEFRECDKILIKNPDFTFQMNYSLESYMMTYISNNKVSSSENHSSAVFTEEMKLYQQNPIVGDYVLISAVVKMPDKRIVLINS